MPVSGCAPRSGLVTTDAELKAVSGTQQQRVFWLPTEGVGRGGHCFPERALLMLPWECCVTTQVRAPVQAGRPANASYVRVVCHGCARRPEGAHAHFHDLLVADAALRTTDEARAHARALRHDGRRARTRRLLTRARAQVCAEPP
jgi:hypothetical protein